MNDLSFEIDPGWSPAVALDYARRAERFAARVRGLLPCRRVVSSEFVAGMNRIVLAVKREFGGLEVDDLYGRGRSEFLANARFAVWYLGRLKFPKARLADFGSLFDRDHGAILNGLNRAQVLLATDLRYAQRVENVRARLNLATDGART